MFFLVLLKKKKYATDYSDKIVHKKEKPYINKNLKHNKKKIGNLDVQERQDGPGFCEETKIQISRIIKLIEVPQIIIIFANK